MILVSLLSPACMIGQCSTDSLSLNIKIVKEYQVVLSKKYFESLYSSGSIKITRDSVPQKMYNIEVAVHNSSTRPIHIWLMSTYWEQNFKINNNYIYFAGRNIDHNYPEIVTIEPGKSKLYHTTLVKSIKFDFPSDHTVFGRQVETTKLGLIIIDDLYAPELDMLWGYNLGMEDESTWKTIWSNPLYLLTNKEADPMPLEIPVNKKD